MRLFLRLLLRSTEGAALRSLFVAASIALGVAAVVGVGALNEAVARGLRLRSRELLGGDLAVESRRKLPDVRPYLPAAQRAAASVELTILPTMVRTESGQSRLAEVKAINTQRGVFPLAGVLEIEPKRPLTELLDDHSALVAPELFSELGLRLGDTLYVGGTPLRVTGVLKREPDPLTFSFAMGPRVLIRSAALARTNLLGFGNRVRYRTLFAFRPELDQVGLARVQAALRARLPGGESYVSVETAAEAQPALRRTLERVQTYLGLVGLLSLLVASVGVAQSVSAWLGQCVIDTAILRCLGLRSREVFWLYLAQVFALALLGSMVGALLGLTFPVFLAHSSPVLLPPELGFVLAWGALSRGIALGLLVPLAFSLLPLLSVWRASPALVLRSAAAPLGPPRGLRPALVVLAALALCGAAWLESGDVQVALVFSLAVLLLGALCQLAARALMRGVGRLPRGPMPALLWQGAAALRRPAAGTVGSMVALGLGTLVVLSIVLLDDLLGRAITTALPERAASVFLVDIQPDQWPAVQRIAGELGATRVESVPVVMARLLAIDGADVQTLLRQRPGDRNARQREQWVLTREQRISWMRTLPEDNQIVAGALWRDPERAELSLEQGFARELGAKLGSVLRFDVQGVPIELTVTSLRTVEWRSFATNFFLVAEPGALDEAPHTRLGALRLPPSSEQTLQDRLAVALPNVTVLRVRGLLERARASLAQVSLAVRLLGGFAVLAGLLVLTGAVAAAQQQRAREAALWKVLGLTRLRVVSLFAVEYALSGAVAGALGAAGAYLLVRLVARHLLSLSSGPSVSACLLAVFATSLLCTVGGLLASLRALLVKPIAILRGGMT